MNNVIKVFPSRIVTDSTSPSVNKIDGSSGEPENADKEKESNDGVESEVEREKGWSDMTETEASDSDDDDDSKLVIDDVSTRVAVSSRLTAQDLDSTRVRSLEETMKFLEGNHSLIQEMSVDESDNDDSDNEIVVSSTGAPDKYGFLTEIYVPKMRGFEDLSDRCILDSVSVNLTLDQVVRSHMDQFNYIMRNTELTDTQREITKYVRRRARNRVSARKSRMKKISDIVRLSQEIKVIRQKKDSLKQERMIMEKLKVSWYKRVSILEDYILEYLREHGEASDIKLEYNNGKIVVAGSEEESKNSNKLLIKDVAQLNNEIIKTNSNDKSKLLGKRSILIYKNNVKTTDQDTATPKNPSESQDSGTDVREDTISSNQESLGSASDLDMDVKPCIDEKPNLETLDLTDNSGNLDMVPTNEKLSGDDSEDYDIKSIKIEPMELPYEVK